MTRSARLGRPTGRTGLLARRRRRCRPRDRHRGVHAHGGGQAPGSGGLGLPRSPRARICWPPGEDRRRGETRAPGGAGPAVRAHAEAIWAMLGATPAWPESLWGAVGPPGSSPPRGSGVPGPGRRRPGVEAGVVLDFVGDTVIFTHAQIEVMRFPAAPSGLGGPAGLEETSGSAAAAGNPPARGADAQRGLAGRGGLDRRSRSSSGGVAAGLPPSATDTGRSASGGDFSGRR